MMNFAMLRIGFFCKEARKKFHENFSSCLSQDRIFSCEIELRRRLKRGAHLQWEVRH